jgi:hypothetical protein
MSWVYINYIILYILYYIITITGYQTIRKT